MVTAPTFTACRRMVVAAIGRGMREELVRKFTSAVYKVLTKEEKKGLLRGERPVLPIRDWWISWPGTPFCREDLPAPPDPPPMRKSRLTDRAVDKFCTSMREAFMEDH